MSHSLVNRLHPSNKGPISLSGARGSAAAFYVAQLASQSQSNVIICDSRNEAEQLECDLEFFSNKIKIALLPAWDSLPFEAVSPQLEIQAERLAAFELLMSDQPHIIVTTSEALIQRSLPISSLLALSIDLSVGSSLSHKEINQKLTAAGYQTASIVENIGDFAVHGEVIDLLPFNSQNGVRLLFGEPLGSPEATIKEILLFNLESQRTVQSIDRIKILPVKEILPYASGLNAHSSTDFNLDKLKNRGKAIGVPPREIARISSAIKHDQQIPGIELYQLLIANQTQALLEGLPKATRIYALNLLGISQAIDSFSELIKERTDRLLEDHQLIPEVLTSYCDTQETLTSLQTRVAVVLNDLDVTDLREQSGSKVNINSKTNTELATKLRSQIGTGKALEPLRLFINEARAKGAVVVCVVGSESRTERLQRILLGENLDARVFKGNFCEWMVGTDPYPLTILQGHLSVGTQLLDEKLVLISENEIFGERSYRKRQSSQASLKKLLNSLAQLQNDDFVVHVDYGVGIYRGLKHIELEGTEGDFLHIEYADSRLYLPVQNINKIQKFSAAEGQAPIVDKLSSNRWIKTKQKVRDSVITLAGDLIKLYATRSVTKGWRFDSQGAEDERFADEFAYNETADQLKAITETLSDMASDRPMDRLICGDVGFGKTEVAIRAAFKCVQHARQVAVLVPTTILVEQHRRTFESRFTGYNFKIGAISRFYSSEDNKKTLAALASGDLDIVIGTHRLLQKDVQFKDLGLIIVDEEHRFGVAQKEKLKSIKKNVDVLTLTATPIPRTLHMSLLSIRDISLIASPPHDRKLIRTYVAQYSDTIVRDALLRELQRNGQAFYLHNRIDSIAGVTDRLKELVPEARFEYAHGQMSEDQLEGIVQRFINKEIDVLISTTIIESGIDIPNANTIIIERADALGLAQLYQLRGRVGRSSRQAYAYLLVPSTRGLGSEAQKRLKALQALDDLGQGFHLAINDLEIRGAGNLLGKEQSGNVLSVGFDLYTKILKEAVASIKGEEVPIEESIDPEVKLGLPSFIPDYYIPDISERLVLYQRLAGFTNPEEADDMRDEIEDRFGPVPKEVMNLIELMRLRAVLRIFGVVKCEWSLGRVGLSFSPKAPIDTGKVVSLVQSSPDIYRFSKSLTLSAQIGPQELSTPLELFRPLEKLLREISVKK